MQRDTLNPFRWKSLIFVYLYFVGISVEFDKNNESGGVRHAYSITPTHINPASLSYRFPPYERIDFLCRFCYFRFVHRLGNEYISPYL